MAYCSLNKSCSLDGCDWPLEDCSSADGDLCGLSGGCCGDSGHNHSIALPRLVHSSILYSLSTGIQVRCWGWILDSTGVDSTGVDSIGVDGTGLDGVEVDDTGSE